MASLEIGVIGKTHEDSEQWARERLSQPWRAFSQDDEASIQGCRLCSVIALEGVRISPRAKRNYQVAMTMSLGGRVSVVSLADVETTDE